MSTKEILQKQNARNTLSKKSKNKLLAVFLSGGLATYTLGAQNTLATTIDTVSYENYNNSVNSKIVPGLTKKTLIFNMAYPTDLVIDNIDLTDLTVLELMVYGKRIDESDLIITNNSITIPKEQILALKFAANRTYNTSINFDDGSYASGYIYIQIIDDASIPPIINDNGSSKPDDGSNDKDNEENTPEQKPGDDDNSASDGDSDGNDNTENNPDKGDDTPEQTPDDNIPSNPDDDSDNKDNGENIPGENPDDDNSDGGSEGDKDNIEKPGDDDIKDDPDNNPNENPGTDDDTSAPDDSDNDDNIEDTPAEKPNEKPGDNDSSDSNDGSEGDKDNTGDKPEQNPGDSDNDDTIEDVPEENPDSDKPEDTYIPVINRQNFVFNRYDPSDIVIKDVDLKGLTITDIYMYGRKMDINKVKVVDNSIVITKEALWDLQFKDGTYYLAFHFSNGAIISNYISITVANSDNVKPPEINDNIGAITPPPNNKPDNDNNDTTPPDNNTGNDSNTKPPSTEDKVEVVKPEIQKQTIIFNRDNASDVVIENVDFKGLTLTEFYIYGRKIDVNKLKVTENSIIIPKEVIFNLYLKNSTYYTSAIFSNGTHVSGVAAIQIVDNATLNPGNKEEDNDDTIRRPSMITQGFEFDLANPMGIEITYVNFDGTKLKNIRLGNKILNSSKFSTTSNSILISADVLKSLGLNVGTHQFVFTFSNGVSLSGYSDLIVVKSTNIINKPSIDINIKENNNGQLEIPNLIPDGVMVNSITINNKVLDVIYRDSYLRNNYIYRNSIKSNPVVYVENSKLIIPMETLSYIGTTSNNYNINIRLDNGSSITQQIFAKSNNNSTSGNSNSNNIISSNNSNNKYTSTLVNTSSNTNSNTVYTNNTINTTQTINDTNKIKNDSNKNIVESIASTANAIPSSNTTKSTNDKINTLYSNDESSTIMNSKKSFIPKFIAIGTGLFVALLAVLSGFKFTKKNN